jgi:dihydrolipoamide dehydrogenase
MDSFDVVVLGAGPGGYVAAIRAAQLGLQTAVIESDEVGGLCLNWGCIPSKALLRNAEVLTLINHAADYGITINGAIEPDLDAAVTRSRRVVDRLVKGVQSLFRKNKITLIKGYGTLKDARTVAVGDQTVQARKGIILATGAKDRVIPGLEPDGQTVVTSRHALERRQLPQRVLIVGGGATGCEFAYFYNAYGSEVTVVEVLPHLLPAEDAEVAQTLHEAFRKQGITVLTDSRIERLDRGEGGVAHVTTPNGGQEVHFDMALVAVGMEGHTDGLGLEAVGVSTVKGGYVAVNERMETTAAGVYAIGDLTGQPLLAHVAMAQGVIAAEVIAGRSTHTLNYVDMPRAVYCHPQVASMGLTDAQAQEQGREVSVGRFPYRASGKALALGEPDGFIKVVSDKKTGEVLGAQMIGPEVTELLGELSLAKLLESTPLEIGRAVHPHPTISEALMEAALATHGEAIHI